MKHLRRDHEENSKHEKAKKRGKWLYVQSALNMLFEDDTFSQCYFIESKFSVLINNAENKYGTASLVKNDLVVENVLCDTGGRVLTFDVSGVTFVNIVTAQLSLNSSWDRQSNQLEHHHPTHPT